MADEAPSHADGAPASEVLDRRRFLKTAGLVALGATVAPACARPSFEYRVVRPQRTFARVQVAPERVIRVVVGLRPVRKDGFRVDSEHLGGKTVIHNYGHGGRGVSLSWGTARLAVEEALRTEHRRAGVIGCGVVGLSTARLLQRAGFEVCIYARDLPPETTSNVALAQWATWFPSEGAEPGIRERYRRANRWSFDHFQRLVGDRYGVRWLDSYSNLEGALEEFSGERPPAHLREFYPGYTVLRRGSHPFGDLDVVHWLGLLIEPAIYLDALLHDFLQVGGRLVVRAFDDLSSLLALPEPLLMNCTGLGARALFGDEGLYPAKGQLVVLPPQPELDYMTDIAGDMVPRRDGILLGSSWEPDVWTLEPNPEVTARILREQAAFFERMG